LATRKEAGFNKKSVRCHLAEFQWVDNTIFCEFIQYKEKNPPYRKAVSKSEDLWDCFLMYKLTPSEFKYLWEECKYCYYQKTRNGVSRPSAPFPSIFNKMSGLLQKSVLGHSPNEFFSGLPEGKFILEEGRIESKPLPSGKSYIKGRLDLLVQFKDGSHGVIDVKMVDPKDENLAKFDKQLHAYKYSLEHPAEGGPISISKMGLLVFPPTDIKPNKGYMYYQAKPIWKEIPQNMDNFFKFTNEVEELLDGPCPPSSELCSFCKYRKTIFSE